MKTQNLLVLCLVLLTAVCLGESAKPTVWLTPARLNVLKQVKEKNHIVKVEQGNGDSVTYTWSDGIKTWTTTEKRKQVLGAKAVNGWQAKVDEEKSAKEEILSALKAISSGKVSKAAIDNVISKAESKTLKNKVKENTK